MLPVNYVSVVVAALIPMVAGFVWYGPLFGKAWMKLSGVSREDVKEANKNMPRLYGTMFVGTLVTAYVLSQFVGFAAASTLYQGAVIGFWAWLGFVAAVMLSGVLFEKKPLKLYYINVGYHLVSFVLMGALLAVWR